MCEGDLWDVVALADVNRCGIRERDTERGEKKKKSFFRDSKEKEVKERLAGRKTER